MQRAGGAIRILTKLMILDIGHIHVIFFFNSVLLVDPHVVPHAHMFVTTTIAMVYWTVFVQVQYNNVPTKIYYFSSMVKKIMAYIL